MDTLRVDTVHCGVQELPLPWSMSIPVWCPEAPPWSMVIPLINRWKKWASRVALGEAAWVSCNTNTIENTTQIQ